MPLPAGRKWEASQSVPGTRRPAQGLPSQVPTERFHPADSGGLLWVQTLLGSVANRHEATVSEFGVFFEGPQVAAVAAESTPVHSRVLGRREQSLECLLRACLRRQGTLAGHPAVPTVGRAHLRCPVASRQCLGGTPGSPGQTPGLGGLLGPRAPPVQDTACTRVQPPGLGTAAGHYVWTLTAWGHHPCEATLEAGWKGVSARTPSVPERRSLSALPVEPYASLLHRTSQGPLRSPKPVPWAHPHPHVPPGHRHPPVPLLLVLPRQELRTTPTVVGRAGPGMFYTMEQCLAVGR